MKETINSINHNGEIIEYSIRSCIEFFYPIMRLTYPFSGDSNSIEIDLRKENNLSEISDKCNIKNVSKEEIKQFIFHCMCYILEDNRDDLSFINATPGYWNEDKKLLRQLELELNNGLIEDAKKTLIDYKKRI